MTRRLFAWACALLAGSAWADVRTAQAPGAQPGSLPQWEARIERELSAGRLTLRRSEADELVPGRRHERFQQRHQGVPVFGAELVRQTDGLATFSVFGSVYEGIELDARPALSADDAKRTVERLAGVRLGPELDAQLVVLPRPDGSGYSLTWTLRAANSAGIRRYFVDAQAGQLVFDYSDLQSSAAVGTGRGTWGDPKKVSADSETGTQGTYALWDRLRPASLRTYDLKGNFQQVIDFFNGFASITGSDLGRDADNAWSDPALVDAHVYEGYTYDYYYKRFGRKGLDDANGSIFGIVHPVRRAEFASYPPELWGSFFANAFYSGGGTIFYGDGLPGGVSVDGQAYEAFSAGLDIVAHELTHGVTDYSSGLIYFGESGALNEAFSDIIGTSVEFYFEPVGSGRLKADWLHAEDVAPPVGYRSLEDPARFGDPDHYSKRYLGPFDGGGVHSNSGIANHAFYLAVQGGTNRSSGQAVQGVGFDNREQIEKVFYRGFVHMLTPGADFQQARAATVQSARELYGAGSPAERAVSQAWSAVGVQ